MGPQAGVVLHVTGQVVMQQGRHRDHAPADHRPATTRRTPLAPAIYHAQRRRAAEPERRVPSSDTTAGAMAAMVALVSSPGPRPRRGKLHLPARSDAAGRCRRRHYRHPRRERSALLSESILRIRMPRPDPLPGDLPRPGRLTYHGLDYLQTSVQYTFVDGSSNFTGGAFSPLAWLLLITATVLVGRLWRLPPVWRRRRAATPTN